MAKTSFGYHSREAAEEALKDNILRGNPLSRAREEVGQYADMLAQGFRRWALEGGYFLGRKVPGYLGRAQRAIDGAERLGYDTSRLQEMLQGLSIMGPVVSDTRPEEEWKKYKFREESVVSKDGSPPSMKPYDERWPPHIIAQQRGLTNYMNSLTLDQIEDLLPNSGNDKKH